MKLLKTICVFGLALCVASSVYAGTQSVKISGDLTVRSIMRGDYDLDRNSAEPLGTAGSPRTGGADDWATYFMSQTEVQIDADLTDNVSAVIRLFNQRDWGRSDKSVILCLDNGMTPLASRGGYTQRDSEFDVGIDIAYIELKEFLYSPLTLKIGRQDIWFGKGFIVGANLRDYNGNISADEYTVMTSFDAIRATLDYDPWTIDLIAAKIWENAIDSSDDEDLFGINIGYVFDVYNAEAETYWFEKRDDSIEAANVKSDNIVNTIGIRGSMDPIENWTVAAETAYQWGTYVGSRDQTEKRHRDGWALDASAECRHFQEQYAWKPVVGAEYIFYSGHKNIQDEENMLHNPRYFSGTYTGWDPMYRGKFDTAIREFQGVFYLTNQDVNNGRVYMTPSYPDAATSNQHQVIIMTSLQPTDSLALDCRYANFWQQYETGHYDRNVSPNETWVDDGRYLGSEIDVQLKWDYTEDVQFGLLAAWFFPGKHYYDQSDDVAHDIVGTVTLSF